MNIPPPLLPLFDQGLVDEVLRPLMSGKEASVYLVRCVGELAVAKVYKDAQHRSFRQRAAYSEGRQVRNSRQRRAMQKGSGYGKSLLEAEWQNSEVQALYRLHEAGVRVPVPYHHGENVLLMQLVADAEGEPAPRLYDLKLTAEAATALHEQLIREVVRMLCAGLVHGDLSEYNILMADDGPVIIDLPQTTDAANNRNSERLFLRDVQNLAGFLGRTAPNLRHTRYGPEIWDLYTRAELHPDIELTGRFNQKEERVDPARALAEIRAAAEEAETRPLSAYQLKKKRKAEEARVAREAEEARRAQQAAQAKRAPPRGPEPRPNPDRAAQNPRNRRDGRPAEPNPARPDHRAAKDDAPAANKKRRRRRRNRNVDRSGEANAPQHSSR